MEHISKPLLKTWLDLASAYEAREINRADLGEALDRGTFNAWPELEPLEEYHREALEAREPMEPGAVSDTPPEGLSPGAEGLWRLQHLRRLGCPRGDLEGLVSLFTAITGLDFAEVAAFVFGAEGMLNVDP